MWNHFSFGLTTGLGFLGLTLFQVLSQRTVHKIHLHNNMEYVDVTFFNAFWVILFLYFFQSFLINLDAKSCQIPYFRISIANNLLLRIHQVRTDFSWENLDKIIEELVSKYQRLLGDLRLCFAW